jgi:pilus assembly protein Flp/PilA
MKLVQFVKTFARQEDGVTAIEYGLIAALIAVVIIGAVTIVGNRLCETFNTIAQKLGGAATQC